MFLKILVIDDHAPLRQLVRSIFEEIKVGHYRFRVFDAPDGETGIALAKNASPDIILLDIDMPNMTGIEVCSSLKGDSATNEIPVIFLTAENTKEMVDEGIQVGGDSYVLKPFEPDSLVKRVGELLGLYREQ